MHFVLVMLLLHQRDQNKSNAMVDMHVSSPSWILLFEGAHMQSKIYSSQQESVIKVQLESNSQVKKNIKYQNLSW
jgi:hypothetical protein